MVQNSEGDSQIYRAIGQVDISLYRWFHVPRRRPVDTIAPPLLRRLDGDEFIDLRRDRRYIIATRATIRQAPFEMPPGDGAITVNPVHAVPVVLVVFVSGDLEIRILLFSEPFRDGFLVEIIAVNSLATEILRFKRIVHKDRFQF